MTLEKRANGFYYTHFSIKGQQVHNVSSLIRKLLIKELSNKHKYNGGKN